MVREPVSTEVATLSFTVPAAVSGLRAARLRLADWLIDQQVTAVLVGDIALVAYEALANAVEHAYRDAVSPGLTAVTARVASREITLSVTDHGRWQDPTLALGATRGHGLAMIQAITRRLDLTHSDGRTTLTAYFDR